MWVHGLAVTLWSQSTPRCIVGHLPLGQSDDALLFVLINGLRDSSVVLKRGLFAKRRSTWQWPVLDVICWKDIGWQYFWPRYCFAFVVKAFSVKGWCRDGFIKPNGKHELSPWAGMLYPATWNNSLSTSQQRGVLYLCFWASFVATDATWFCLKSDLRLRSIHMECLAFLLNRSTVYTLMKEHEASRGIT